MRVFLTLKRLKKLNGRALGAVIILGFCASANIRASDYFGEDMLWNWGDVGVATALGVVRSSQVEAEAWISLQDATNGTDGCQVEVWIDGGSGSDSDGDICSSGASGHVLDTPFNFCGDRLIPMKWWWIHDYVWTPLHGVLNPYYDYWVQTPEC